METLDQEKFAPAKLKFYAPTVIIKGRVVTVVCDAHAKGRAVSFTLPLRGVSTLLAHNPTRATLQAVDADGQRVGELGKPPGVTTSVEDMKRILDASARFAQREHAGDKEAGAEVYPTLGDADPLHDA